MTTAVEDSKVIDGEDHPGDPDLVLHFATCRAAGRRLGAGPPAEQIFAPVPPTLLINQFAVELAWAREHAATEYAVLNACRAWRFLRDSTLVSKIDAGQWARAPCR